jgi:penicillin-binding protein 1A
MRDIHQGLPKKDFIRPATGVVDVTVCAKSGLIPTSSCNEGRVTLTFLSGTQPGRYCDVHADGNIIAGVTGNRASGYVFSGGAPASESDGLPSLPAGLFDNMPLFDEGVEEETNPDYGLDMPDYNPLLD